LKDGGKFEAEFERVHELLPKRDANKQARDQSTRNDLNFGSLSNKIFARINSLTFNIFSALHDKETQTELDGPLPRQPL
jgi:hypothetical protein